MSSMKPIRRLHRHDEHTAPFLAQALGTGADAPCAGRDRCASEQDSGMRWPESMEEILASFDSMSRRINDLARELNCLGHFDDPNDDLPRAA